MKVTLPIRTVSLTNMREHWAVTAKRAKKHRAVVGWMMPRGVPLPCVVKFTRVSPATCDDDNLPSCFKSVRDEIAKLSGVDDADPRIKWEYAQQTGKRGKYEVIVEVSPV